MYTLMDLNFIKKDSDRVLFTKDSPEYIAYVDHCDGATPSVAVANATLYESAMGSYKGKSCIFCKLKASGKAKKASYLDANKKRKRGLLIGQLCQAVIEYISGKNDADGLTSAQVDTFLATHGAILTPLSQNRHTSAKELIDAITPDSFVSQGDLDNIQDLYNAYLPKINAVV